MDKRKPKIVFIAQTPPPFLGQSIMHKFLIDSDWKEIIKKHIRLDLTSSSDQFGRFSLKKVLSICHVVLLVWIERLKGRIDILYYPPSGPVNRKTFYKDLSLLLFTRFLAKKTVFHFHADHFDNLLYILNKIEIRFAKMIYKNSDLCIVILEPQIDDLKWITPKKIVVIPNGIKDKFNPVLKNYDASSFNILYLGLLVPYKGIEYAVYASRLLKERNVSFKWTFVGGWSSSVFKDKILRQVKEFGLNDYIVFVGEKIEDEKWVYFSNSDVLCLPTYTDLMPLCILEGMMMSLPVITTNLRTLPYIFDDKIEGFFVPPKDSISLAEKIEYLYRNRELTKSMGSNARMKFENCYTIEKHIDKIKYKIYDLLKN